MDSLRSGHDSKQIKLELKKIFGKDVTSVIYPYLLDKCNVCEKKSLQENVKCIGCHKYICDICL